MESGRVAFEQAARAERYQTDPVNETVSDPEGGVGDSSLSFSFQHKSRAGSHSPPLRAPSMPIAQGGLGGVLQAANSHPNLKPPPSVRDHHKSGYRSAAQTDEREKRAAAALPRSNSKPQRAARPRSQQRTAPARLPDMTGPTSVVEVDANPNYGMPHDLHS